MRNIGVNGFGRIGRYFTRLSLKQNDFNVALINDLSDIKTLAHLFKYDSIHGILDEQFEINGNTLIFKNGKKIAFTQFKNPEDIPWEKYGVQHVLEATGIFRSKETASLHFKGGAKKVVLSAPAQNEGFKTIVMGVNDYTLTADDKLISNASCTTNSGAPIIKVLSELCKIESAYLSTIHSYTSDQRLHDAPHSDLRRARAAANSIVPTTTGAAKALSKIFPELEGKIGGAGIRVPVINGSLTDLTITASGNIPTVKEINDTFKKASENELKGILDYTDEPIVSVDIIGNPHSSIFDSQLTSVIESQIKIVAWYDNEAGFSNRLIDLFKKI